MIHKIFSIYDDKAQAYLPPFFLPTVGMAARAFKDCCNSKSHQFGANPSDFTLFELGEFDDRDGTIQTRAAHKSHGNGLTYIVPSSSERLDELELLGEIDKAEHRSTNNAVA